MDVYGVYGGNFMNLNYIALIDIDCLFRGLWGER